jgi:hypothetical protein
LASSVNSQAQIMLDLRPGQRLPLARLFQASTQFFRFRRREHVMGIHQALRLDEHDVGLLAERHEVALVKFEGFEHIPRDNHLAALPHASNPLLSCGCLPCHAFRLSDGRNLVNGAFVVERYWQSLLNAIR